MDKKVIDAFNVPHLGVCLDAVNNLGLGESFREVLGTLALLRLISIVRIILFTRKPSMLGFDVEGAVTGEGFLDLELARKVLPANISWVLESWMPWQRKLKDRVMEKEWVIKGLYNLRSFRETMKINL